MFKENVMKVFASLVVESVEKNHEEAAPSDMSLTYLDSGYVLGGVISKGEYRVKEGNDIPLGDNYAPEVQRVLEKVDFGSVKNLKNSVMLVSAGVQGVERL